MLKADDLDKDYSAIMSNIEHLRKTSTPPSCGDWPSPNLTIKEDLKDLKWHEEKHLKKEVFTFTVMNLDESKCLGSVYFFPCENKEFDAEIYFWVIKEEYDKGLEKELQSTIKDWIKKKNGLLKKLFFQEEINLLFS